MNKDCRQNVNNNKERLTFAALWKAFAFGFFFHVNTYLKIDNEL